MASPELLASTETVSPRVGADSTAEVSANGAFDGLRVGIFTHDTFGLGHVRRCLHILEALSRLAPRSALLLLTGSPALPMLTSLPPNADLIKLPTIVRTGRAGAQPPHLPIGLNDVTAIRTALVHEALTAFCPDIFLVDNFPLGARRELIPALEALGDLGGRAVLGLRDIVGAPETVREEWRRDRVHGALEELYDRILVYGPPGLVDVAEAYEMPRPAAAKLRYCGYVGPQRAVDSDPGAVRAELGLTRPYLMATVGGGGDGLPLITAFLGAMESFPDRDALVVTGPLMGREERAALEELAAGSGRVKLCDYLPDLPRYMAAAEVVVAMGGYNTVAEIAVQGCPAVIVPRTWRYGEHSNRATAETEGEQLLRAEALAARGLAEMLHPDALSPASLAERIAAALARPRRGRGPAIETGGATRAAEHVLQLAEQRALRR